MSQWVKVKDMGKCIGVRVCMFVGDDEDYDDDDGEEIMGRQAWEGAPGH